MKRLFALFLALGLIVTTCACSSGSEEKTEAPAKETTEATEENQMVLGTLSLLNMTEDERLELAQGRSLAVKYLVDQGVLNLKNAEETLPEVTKVVFYDSLDAMIMALEAGEITHMEVPRCTADYLCALNDQMEARGSYDLDAADNFANMLAHRLGLGYSFLTTEDNVALRDQINNAIAEMTDDGTLAALTQTYITDAVGSDPKPVEFEKADGATYTVAVTGLLPPMDYVAMDGTFAGFNTALLAELGKRLDVNFELVQVDSMGRAAALSSGQVDLVFWTNGSDGRRTAAGMTDEEFAEFKAEEQKKITEEQYNLMESLDVGYKRGKMDVPEGTIVSQPYYNDMPVIVALKN